MENALSASTVAATLRSINLNENNLTAFVGFDGFVDTIVRAVKTETNSEYRYFETITEFSSHLAEQAGKSGQIELAPHEYKLGGNCPIMAHALGTLGVKTKCVGALGFPSVHNVFRSLHPNCETLSVCNPGITTAFEFNDGKLMFSDLSSLRAFDWDYLKTVVNITTLIDHLTQSELIALVDWANLHNGTQLWKGILEEIVPQMLSSGLTFYFDLADPSKKPEADIIEILEVISNYSKYGEVILGLSEGEAIALYRGLKSIPQSEHVNEPIELIGQFLFGSMTIDTLIIHPLDRVYAFTSKGVQQIGGYYTTSPKISTGGGDNFNAGFCFGKLLNLNLANSLLLGVATAAAYVQKGYSPDINELIDFLESNSK